MKIAYSAIATEASGLTIRAASQIENVAGEDWTEAVLSYHVFDPESGTVIYDGPRYPIEARTTIAIELPPEPGRYRVFLSPMWENAGWAYDRGAEFLLIDAVVEGGAARVERTRVFTMRALKRELLLRSAGRAFELPAMSLWRNRSLIRAMVRRDILGRYRGSFGGIFWTVLNPLLLMLTYFFVFGIVLQARFGADPSRSGFVLYFLAGMLPWLAFSEAVGRAPTVMLEHRNFIKKLVFPVETLPVNLVTAGLVTETFAVLLFAIFVLAARGHMPATVLWLPVILVPQILFTLGLCWFLAAIGVFVRDLGQVIGFLLTLWFFLTPICYPETSLPKEALAVLSKNPIFALVRAYRAIFLEGHAPAWSAAWKLWATGGAAFILGHACFHKLRRSFADII